MEGMVLKLSRLQKSKVFMDHLRFDVTPKAIFKPRFIMAGEDNKRELVMETQGFSFYIETFQCDPALMVMKTYNLRSKTIGHIEEAPAELLSNAVSREGAEDVHGMYPIDDGVRDWLKKELGLA